MKKIKRKRPKKKSETPAEDAALWVAVKKTVAPMLGRDLPPNQTGAKPPAPVRPITQSRPRPDVIHMAPLPELSHGDQPGLDKSTAKRLRRGKVKIEARLDLHGMTQAEARPALVDFLDRAWYAGKREVLVITGKGTRADGRIGVLREAVPRWLNDGENRSRITAFTHAAAKDGGEGALYVRLKKRHII
ncbi:MAG: Smr/MutS family protein [Magnetovibrio sp.]|nr:Smr/MutS family protein [Magnetovibrio sp.]